MYSIATRIQNQNECDLGHLCGCLVAHYWHIHFNLGLTYTFKPVQPHMQGWMNLIFLNMAKICDLNMIMTLNTELRLCNFNPKSITLWCNNARVVMNENTGNIITEIIPVSKNVNSLQTYTLQAFFSLREHSYSILKWQPIQYLTDVQHNHKLVLSKNVNITIVYTICCPNLQLSSSDTSVIRHRCQSFTAACLRLSSTSNPSVWWLQPTQ